jgi:hypothetical protein
MYNIDDLHTKLSLLELSGTNKIFEHSKYENSYNPAIENSVMQIINKNTNLSAHAFIGMDICCGYGFMLQSLKRNYSDSTLIGIDIDRFNSWVTNVDNLSFYTADMFKLIELDLNFKFDIIFTFNTLRGTIDQWGYDNYHNFLKWCAKYTNYLITNNCTLKPLNGFKLLDTIAVPNNYDINLFKPIAIE